MRMRSARSDSGARPYLTSAALAESTRSSPTSMGAVTAQPSLSVSSERASSRSPARIQTLPLASANTRHSLPSITRSEKPGSSTEIGSCGAELERASRRGTSPSATRHTW